MLVCSTMMAKVMQPAVTTVLASNIRLVNSSKMGSRMVLVSIAGVGIGQAGCDEGDLGGVIVLGLSWIGSVECLASVSEVTGGGSSVGWSVETIGASKSSPVSSVEVLASCLVRGGWGRSSLATSSVGVTRSVGLGVVVPAASRDLAR